MKVYQISYDLRKQRNYNALYERIRNLGDWCHALESSWVVVTELDAISLHDYLKQVMDADDGLLVTRLKGEAAWSGLDPKVRSWLKQRLEACSLVA